MRANSRIWKAIAVSFGLHLALVLGLLRIWNSRSGIQSGSEFSASHCDIHVNFSSDEDERPSSKEIVLEKSEVNQESVQPESKMVVEVPSPVKLNEPISVQIVQKPRQLPNELLEMLRKNEELRQRDATALVDAGVKPTHLNPHPSSSPIQQAAADEGVNRSVSNSKALTLRPLEGGVPLHGAFERGQIVVYVLDCSGSMGESGKFSNARRALVASLRTQPDTVRFQVVIYSSIALKLLPVPSYGCLPATVENVERMAAALATLPLPVGRSNHADGLREAMTLRPDSVIVLTDADDLPPATVRGLLRQVDRPAAIYLARATAEGIDHPRQIK